MKATCAICGKPSLPINIIHSVPYTLYQLGHPDKEYAHLTCLFVEKVSLQARARKEGLTLEQLVQRQQR